MRLDQWYFSAAIRTIRLVYTEIILLKYCEYCYERFFYFITRKLIYFKKVRSFQLSFLYSQNA